jgi:hypothetical protein
MEGTSSMKRTARITGILYFIFAVVSIYGYMYVPSQITVAGNMEATAKNILANEFLFRTSIVSNLTGHILFIVLVLYFYKLLKPVNEHYARIMVGLVIVGIPVSFVVDVFRIAPLVIFKGDLLKSFESGQITQLTELLIKLGSFTGRLVSTFWGLWLIPLGLLIYKSGFIPRIFGVLLFLNAAGYVINSLTFLLFPDYLATVSKTTMVFLFVGEIPLIFWLLIKGVKTSSVT